MILLCILLTLHDSISLRSCSRNIKTFFSFIFSKCYTPRIPSNNIISRWIKRIGLYKLQRPLEHASDWIAIADASIGIGTKKVLMILGIPRKKFEALITKEKPLRLEDVTPLRMEIVDSCNSAVVQHALQQTEVRAGKIYQICIDGGSDMQAGSRLFIDEVLKTEKRQIYATYDAPHKIACFLKKRLEDNSRWGELTSMAAKLRLKQQQSKFSHLIAPSQRSKARYMNLSELVTWSEHALMFLDLQERVQNKTMAVMGRGQDGKGNDTVMLNSSDYKLLLEDFGWLKPLEKDIRLFSEYDLIGTTVRHHVRTQGISARTHSELDKILEDLPLKCQEAYQFCGECLDFIEEQTRGLKKEDLLLGSDEVIESLFGKMKRLLNENAKHGLTSFVLAAASSCGELSEEMVDKALTTIKNRDVDNWSQINLGETYTSKRRRCFKIARMLKIETEKVGGIFQEVRQKFIEAPTNLEETDPNHQWQCFKVKRMLKIGIEEVGRKFAGLSEASAQAA
jgi:hypothetical protein